VGYLSHRGVASCYIRICCGIRLSAIKQKINKQTCSSLSTSTSCHASYHCVPPASQLVIVACLHCQNENQQFAVMKRMTEPSLGVGTNGPLLVSPVTVLTLSIVPSTLQLSPFSFKSCAKLVIEVVGDVGVGFELQLHGT